MKYEELILFWVQGNESRGLSLAIIDVNIFEIVVLINFEDCDNILTLQSNKSITLMEAKIYPLLVATMAALVW